MKSINKILPLAALLITCTACSDSWDDHYDVATTGSKQTLWQEISTNSDLSDFSSVLSNTYVYRHHKKSTVSYADLLNSGQAFTVWAPQNGTFNKDSLITLCQTAIGDSSVEKMFVKNHIARSTFSVVEDSDDIMFMNTKHLTLGFGKIGDVTISSANNRAKNGILHIINKELPYQYNIYEALVNMNQFQSMGTFLKGFEKDSLDEENSLSSGLVDGVPVYIDSVLIEKNSMLDGFGYINSEDSSYWMVAPSATGFSEAYDSISNFFNYAYINKADSLQRYWTYRALMDDAFFDMNIQSSPNDSLVSTRYNLKKWKDHVFYKPFEEGGILNQTTKKITCSNGILYQTDKWPFKYKDTFFKEITTEGEKESNITNSSLCSYNIRYLSADSISNHSYIDIVASPATANWTMTYKIDNTLAGTYDICAVILPNSVYNTVKPDTRPNKFKATLKYYDVKGKLQTYNCGNATFMNNINKVDTIVLAKAFKLPTCNYQQDNTNVTLTLTCSILARETSTYLRETFIDCIYLKPISEEK
jgi:hypothetical protein